MPIPGLVRQWLNRARPCGPPQWTLPCRCYSVGRAAEMVPAAIVHGFIISLLVPILMAFFSA
ncbi:LysO family transporter [Shigella flexneri]